MRKVHPNASLPAPPPIPALPSGGGDHAAAAAVALTVWRKSLLLNCNGFTVFDDKGNLVFRVDNYASGNKGEIVLMDGAGDPVLTIRRKKLSLGGQWLIYQGEEETNPRFSVKRHVSPIGCTALAHVTPCGDGRGAYAVEGSYSRRSCAVYDEGRRRMAEIRRKESVVGGVAFGVDVFRLIVEPGFEAAVAMAIVILLNQMFGSKGSLIRALGSLPS